LIFTETKLAGAYVIELERRTDPRGFFARTFCQQEFEAHGLKTEVVQCNVFLQQTQRDAARNALPGGAVLGKQSWCGALRDRFMTLSSTCGLPRRRSSSTSLWNSPRRTEECCTSPEDFAHGFQTLQDDTEVFYQMAQRYSAEHARGARWNDPAFRIEWPEGERIIIERDRNYPDFVS